MKIGYARVSTIHQHLDRQIAALRACGCDRIFREKASGHSTKGRPQLECAIDQLGCGDTLVLAEWDRATRSMMDGIRIMQRVASRSATVLVLDRPHFDLTTPMGRGFLAFLSAMAEDERERIKTRAADGRRAARAAGRRLGRSPKLTPHQVKLVLARLADGDSCRAIAADLGVHHSTISRVGRDSGEAYPK